MASPKQASRKERRKAERQARKERNQKEKEKYKNASRARTLLLYCVGTLLLVGAGYWAYGQWTSGSPGEFVPSMGNRHVGPPEVGLTQYNSDPPSSGPHLPSIARWGIHEAPIPKELQVHNLEDGGVLVQYNCPPTNQECGTLIEKLAQIVRRYDHAILAPYPGMKQKIALTAWSRIDRFNEFDEKRIVRFIDAYINVDHHPRK
ncbi:MAG: DUF3105 domain-containing protein [Deltaproteobacteria bacterium]|nr:DUF3105 domain-containing protein [Deltaproteobacteria bacterium]